MDARSTPILPLAASLVVTVAALAGCQTAPEAKPKAGPEIHARDYVSLAVGNRWVYRTEPAPEDAALTEVKIVAEDDRGFFVDNQGTRLQTRVEGVFDGDRFILEDPLEVGHSWMAVPTASEVERYEVVAVNLEHGVPAGHFSNCVRVRAQQEGRSVDGRPMRLIMLWTYAPGVGLIELEQRVELKGKPPRRVGLRQLVEYEIGGTGGDADS